MLDKFISPEFTEFDTETGYFDLLNSSFKSSGDDIQRSYLKKMQEILKDKEKLSLKRDKYMLQDLSKLVNTYKILEKEDDRQEYLSRLRLRSLASQYNSISTLIKDGYFFPWLIFIVKQGTEQRIIELDFVEASEGKDVFVLYAIVEMLRIVNRKPFCMKLFHFKLVFFRECSIHYVSLFKQALLNDVQKKCVRS